MSVHLYRRPEPPPPATDGRPPNIRVPTLFHIVSHYVGANFLQVEGFIGFPEDIAKQLFDAAARCDGGSFAAPNLATSATIGNLDAAYGAAFASSLDLSRLTRLHYEGAGWLAPSGRDVVVPAAPLFANIAACSHLSALDLSGCRLGESETLFALARDALLQLRCLTRLHLDDNALCDKHVWSLTRPAAVLGEGLVMLQQLSVVDNRLTATAARHLCALRALRVIWLSGNHVTQRMYEERCADLPLRPADGVLPPSSAERAVASKGWGVAPFERWAELARSQAENAASRACNSFYSSTDCVTTDRRAHRGPILTLTRDAKRMNDGWVVARAKKPKVVAVAKDFAREDIAEYLLTYS